LEADFTAGLEVTRAVIAFARACPTGGPHLDDLPNAAFVQAMYKTVTPQLQGEIDALTRVWACWLPVVGRWTPASTEVPPPRPASPAHSHVLATVDAWWEAEQESTRERLVGMLTNAGGEMTGTSIDVGVDGQMIETTHVRFESKPGALRGGVMRRIRGWISGRRPPSAAGLVRCCPTTRRRCSRCPDPTSARLGRQRCRDCKRRNGMR
jgi:hypothetical protein